MDKRKTTINLSPLVGMELERKKRSKVIQSMSEYIDKTLFDALFKTILVMKETRERFMSFKKDVDEDTLLNLMMDAYERETREHS